jgi:hypothetical protein
MAWIEAEASNHCKLLIVLLTDIVLNKYTEWSVC